jgi:hypothetical protein
LRDPDFLLPFKKVNKISNTVKEIHIASKNLYFKLGSGTKKKADTDPDPGKMWGFGSATPTQLYLQKRKIVTLMPIYFYKYFLGVAVLGRWNGCRLCCAQAAGFKVLCV